MKLLAFLTPDALDIKKELQNDLVWALARDKLCKMNAFKLPCEKINCVVECACILFRSLNLARAKSESADEMSNSGTALYCSTVLRCIMLFIVVLCSTVVSIVLVDCSVQYVPSTCGALHYVLSVRWKVLRLDRSFSP